jgi:hypothetical protein
VFISGVCCCGCATACRARIGIIGWLIAANSIARAARLRLIIGNPHQCQYCHRSAPGCETLPHFRHGSSQIVGVGALLKAGSGFGSSVQFVLFEHGYDKQGTGAQYIDDRANLRIALDITLCLLHVGNLDDLLGSDHPRERRVRMNIAHYYGPASYLGMSLPRAMDRGDGVKRFSVKAEQAAELAGPCCRPPRCGVILRTSLASASKLISIAGRS